MMFWFFFLYIYIYSHLGTVTVYLMMIWYTEPCALDFGAVVNIKWVANLHVKGTGLKLAPTNWGRVGYLSSNLQDWRIGRHVANRPFLAHECRMCCHFVTYLYLRSFLFFRFKGQPATGHGCMSMTDGVRSHFYWILVVSRSTVNFTFSSGSCVYCMYVLYVCMYGSMWFVL